MKWSDLDDPGAFDRYMESVDDRLRTDGVDIANRPLHSMGVISAGLRISFSMRSDVFRRIEAWWEQRYGPRLLIDWSPGSMLIEIRGDPFEVKYPRVYGTQTINGARLIQGITAQALGALTESELGAVAKQIGDGLKAFQAMENTPASLQSDLTTAVVQLLKRPPDPGLSKWSSQQAVEKTLNGFVEAKGQKPKRPTGHDLLPLIEQAESLGLPQLDRAAVAEAQCSPQVRYPGRIATSASSAVRANQAAVCLCGTIAACWPK
jgi:hypothetical protein